MTKKSISSSIYADKAIKFKKVSLEKYLKIKQNFKSNHDLIPLMKEIILGVRERFYSDEELKEWIRHGKIREFKRQS